VIQNNGPRKNLTEAIEQFKQKNQQGI